MTILPDQVKDGIAKIQAHKRRFAVRRVRRGKHRRESSFGSTTFTDGESDSQDESEFCGSGEWAEQEVSAVTSDRAGEPSACFFCVFVALPFFCLQMCCRTFACVSTCVVVFNVVQYSTRLFSCVCVCIF